MNRGYFRLRRLVKLPKGELFWAAESAENYVWLCILGIELCKEYTYRYEKEHKCEAIIKDCLRNILKDMTSKGLIGDLRKHLLGGRRSRYWFNP